MSLKKIAAFVAIVGVAGCSGFPHVHPGLPPPPPPKVEIKPVLPIVVPEAKNTSYKPPLTVATLPPNINEYDNINDDVIVLKGYATDLNWYMFYLFSYTHVINQFAIARGWTPPETAPLCKTFTWPKQMDVPLFEYREGMALEDLDFELTLFISEAKAHYEGQQRLFTEAELWQRQLCMY